MLWSVGIHCEKIQQNPCKIPLKSWKHPVKMHLSPNRNFHMLPKSCPQILGDRRNTAAFHKAQSVRQLNLLRLRSQTYFAGGFWCFGWHGVKHYSGKISNISNWMCFCWCLAIPCRPGPPGLLASGRRSQASGDGGQSPWFFMRPLGSMFCGFQHCFQRQPWKFQ
jgi:hypothetical protein